MATMHFVSRAEGVDVEVLVAGEWFRGQLHEWRCDETGRWTGWVRWLQHTNPDADPPREFPGTRIDTLDQDLIRQVDPYTGQPLAAAADTHPIVQAQDLHARRSPYPPSGCQSTAAQLVVAPRGRCSVTPTLARSAADPGTGHGRRSERRQFARSLTGARRSRDRNP